MRLLSSMAVEDEARRFGDYLAAVGVKNSIEEGASGWSIWITDDDDLERAKLELAQFTGNPGDAKYAGAGKVARAQRAMDEKRERKLRRNYVDVRTSWGRPSWSVPPATLTLIAICVLVAALTGLGYWGGPVMKYLMFASSYIEWEAPPEHGPDRPPPAEAPPERGEPDGEIQHEEDALAHPTLEERLWPILHGEIRRGQIWRLVTPIFLHFGPIHLIFNLFWLRDLGSAIERRKKWWFLLLLVLVSAVVSNVAQSIASGPTFGGMSGVVYALFGYIWMKGKFEPWEGLGVPPNTVTVMLVWLAICYTGLVGPIANTAHVVGLVVGALIGGGPGFWGRARRRMRWS